VRKVRAGRRGIGAGRAQKSAASESDRPRAAARTQFSAHPRHLLEALLRYPSQKLVTRKPIKTDVAIDWAVGGIREWVVNFPYAFEKGARGKKPPQRMAHVSRHYSTDRSISQPDQPQTDRQYLHVAGHHRGRFWSDAVSRTCGRLLCRPRGTISIWRTGGIKRRRAQARSIRFRPRRATFRSEATHPSGRPASVADDHRPVNVAAVGLPSGESTQPSPIRAFLSMMACLIWHRLPIPSRGRPFSIFPSWCSSVS